MKKPELNKYMDALGFWYILKIFAIESNKNVMAIKCGDNQNMSLCKADKSI